MMLISRPHSFAGYRGSVIVTGDLNRPPRVLHKDYGSRYGVGAKPDGRGELNNLWMAGRFELSSGGQVVCE